MDKEKVLITGGAGYIGSILTGQLLESGYKVTCLDNLIFEQTSPLIYVNNPNFDFIYGDVRDERLLSNVLPNFDIILPLAAIVGMPASQRKPEETYLVNYKSIETLNKLRSKDQRLIFPTTNSGYGTKSGDIYCTEETPLEPISLYGKTKVEAEKFLLESDKDAITLRFATVFGFSPRMRTDLLVNDFTLKAVRDSYIVLYQAHFKRNYIHIKDAARCFEHCINNFDLMKNKPYNVGLDDANLSKLELAERIKNYIPKFEIICKEIGEDPDKRNYVISNKRILSTGFNLSFSLDDGIKELIKGYKMLLKTDKFRNS